MKKKFLLFSLMLTFMLTITNVHALELAKVGESVETEGTYDSLRLIAANHITDKEVVDGISLVAGNSVSFSGTTTYGFFAGNVLTVEGQIEKDTFVAGNIINVTSGATVGRDLFIAGNTINVNTNIERDLRIGGDNITLRNTIIGGDAYLMGDNIYLDENTTITGTLVYPEKATITGLEVATVGKVETVKTKDYSTVKPNYSLTIYDFLISWFAGCVALIVLFFILPKAKEKLDKLEFTVPSVLYPMLIGLAVLLVVPLVLIIGIISGILTPVALITGCVYGISIYLSVLISAYVIGHLLFTKVFKQDNKLLAIVCGVLIIKLIKLIPIVGGFVTLVTLTYGLGLISKFIWPKK